MGFHHDLPENRTGWGTWSWLCLCASWVFLWNWSPVYPDMCWVCLCSLGTHTEPHCQLALGPGACSSLASTEPLDLSGCDSDLLTWACSQVGAKDSLCQDYCLSKTVERKKMLLSYVFKLTNSLSVKAAWWHAAKSPIPSTQAYPPCNTAWLGHTWAGKVDPKGIKLLRNQSWVWFVSWMFVCQSVPSMGTAWGMCWDKSPPKAVSQRR